LVVPPTVDIEMKNEDKQADPFASKESTPPRNNSAKKEIDNVSEELEDLDLDDIPKPRVRNKKRR